MNTALPGELQMEDLQCRIRRAAPVGESDRAEGIHLIFPLDIQFRKGEREGKTVDSTYHNGFLSSQRICFILQVMHPFRDLL